MLAGTGPRSDPASAQEVAEYFGLPTIRLTLVDPRFYHLDTALAVLNERTIAYDPPAFDATSPVVRGSRVLPVDTTELRKAGGGAKCCVLEQHSAGVAPATSQRDIEPMGDRIAKV